MTYDYDGQNWLREPQNPAAYQNLTDCDRFAAEVATIAFSSHSDPYMFTAKLKDRFTKEGYVATNAEFGSSGFKDEFRDPDPTSGNQVRHYVGGFRASFLAGFMGESVMGGREISRPGDSETIKASHKADIALNRVAFRH